MRVMRGNHTRSLLYEMRGKQETIGAVQKLHNQAVLSWSGRDYKVTRQ